LISSFSQKSTAVSQLNLSAKSEEQTSKQDGNGNGILIKQLFGHLAFPLPIAAAGQTN